MQSSCKYYIFARSWILVLRCNRLGYAIIFSLVILFYSVRTWRVSHANQRSVRNETVAIIMRPELCGNMGFVVFRPEEEAVFPGRKPIKLWLKPRGPLDRLKERVECNLISISHNETICSWRVCGCLLSNEKGN